MKKLLMLVVFVFVAGAVFASQTDSTQGDVQAKIVAPLEVAHASGAALNFGTLVSPESAGSVVIDPVATPTPHDSNVQRATGGVSSDHFTVTNSDNVPYNVVFDSSSITIQKTGDTSKTMTVSNFTHSCTADCTATDIYVGGQLAVGAEQASGVYTGHYSIHLTY